MDYAWDTTSWRVERDSSLIDKQVEATPAVCHGCRGTHEFQGVPGVVIASLPHFHPGREPVFSGGDWRMKAVSERQNNTF